MLTGRQSAFNGEGIVKIRASSEGLDKSFYKKGTDMLGRHSIDCISQEENYVNTNNNK